MKPGKPSETAIRIAIHRVLAARDPVLRPLLSDPDEPFAEWFVHGHSPDAVSTLERRRTQVGSEFYARLSDKLDPGGPLSLLLRKRYVEEQVRQAIAAGLRQLVVIGAGYDTLPLRLLREPLGLAVYELDHPATQAVKRRVLEEHGAVPPGLVFVAADLSVESAHPVLVAAGFRSEEPAVFLSEGVIMYLEATAVDTLFAEVARCAAPGSRFVFSFIEPRAPEERDSPLGRTARFVALVGEPFRSSQDPATLAHFLRARGFTLRSLVDRKTLRERFLEPLGIDRPVRQGEWVAVAERTGEAP